MSKSDVIVVGSVNVDLVSYVDRLPKPGETMSGNSFKVFNGGKGANQAVMPAILREKTTMLAKVGTDNLGAEYIAKFNDYNVDTSHIIRSSEESTGTATILVSKQGENCIVIIPGTNGLLTAEEVTDKLNATLSGRTVVVTQMEINRAVTLKAMQTTKAAGGLTLFNAAPAYADIDESFYQCTDILCVNETEAQILTNSATQVVPNDSDSEKAVLGQLLKLGPACVLLTLGKAGCRLVFKDQPEKVISCTVEIDQSKVVDTTGAGDCFIGTVAAFLSKGIKKTEFADWKQLSTLKQLLTEEVLFKANTASSLSVQKQGAQASYPQLSELPDSFK